MDNSPFVVAVHRSWDSHFARGVMAVSPFLGAKVGYCTIAELPEAGKPARILELRKIQGLKKNKTNWSRSMNQNSSMESSGELSALFTRSEIHPVVDGVCVIFLFLETPIEKQRLDKAVQFKKHIDWICSLKHINELPPNIVRLSADGF